MDPLSTLATSVSTPQLSEVSGVFQEVVPRHMPGSVPTVTLGGRLVITGNSRSVTVIRIESWWEFPLSSVIVKVTSVVPTSKCSPDCLSDSILATPQLSVPNALSHSAIAEHRPASAMRSMSLGIEVKTGSSASVTTTSKETSVSLK